MNKIRVMVVDDHPGFRDGLCRFIEDEDDLDVIARPADGEEAVRLAGELQPDVIIMDVSMPKLNGIEATKEIKALSPATAIIMVSAYSYEAYTLGSLQAGAAGYMLKNAPVTQLVSAIRLVNTGETVLDIEATRQMLRRLSYLENGQDASDSTELYPRELEVLRQVAKGRSNKEIARQLLISERTVQTHLVNIFRKLNVSSRTEAVLHGLKRGWILLDELP